MTINRQTAQRLWEKRFQGRLAVKDIFGSCMRKDAYNKRGVDGAWNIHHIRPLSEGGSNDEANLMIISIGAHDQIGGSYPSYKVNDKVYDVKKVNGVYKIVHRQAKQPAAKPTPKSRWKEKREIAKDARDIGYFGCYSKESGWY